MIRGYFSTAGPRQRPFVHAVLRFSAVPNRSFAVELLVDTGADRTILAPLDALRFSRRLGVDLTTLPRGQASTGMGGHMETRVIDAVLTLESFSTPLAFTVLEAPPERLPIPSLLGRDILSRFALYVEQAENLVLLLEPEEAATVRPHLP